MPSFDSGDDFAWVLGPREGLGIDVRSGEEACNGGLQLGDGAEYAALEPLARQLGKLSLDGIVQAGANRLWIPLESGCGFRSKPALSQEADVGVKWKVQRGCWASHSRTCGCLWVA